GLDALEPVLPRNHQAHGRAVLIRKRFTVHSDAKQSQRIHSFVNPKALDITKLNPRPASLRHLPRIVITLEGNELSLGCRFNQLYEIAERKANPGNHNGPRFHAAVAVDALLKRRYLQDFLHGELARLGDVSFHGNHPVGSVELLR